RPKTSGRSTLSLPEGGWRREAISSRAASSSFKALRQLSRKLSPSAVNRKRRVVRSISLTARWRSSRETDLATAEFERLIRRAARVKLPPSTLSTKATIPCRLPRGIIARLANLIPQCLLDSAPLANSFDQTVARFAASVGFNGLDISRHVT